VPRWEPRSEPHSESTFGATAGCPLFAISASAFGLAQLRFLVSQRPEQTRMQLGAGVAGHRGILLDRRFGRGEISGAPGREREVVLQLRGVAFALDRGAERRRGLHVAALAVALQSLLAVAAVCGEQAGAQQEGLHRCRPPAIRIS
jgi:hypothetical protein